MNRDIIKLSKTFLDGSEDCDLQETKIKLRDIERETITRMGELETSDIKHNIRKCATTANNVLVSNNTNLVVSDSRATLKF